MRELSGNKENKGENNILFTVISFEQEDVV